MAVPTQSSRTGSVSSLGNSPTATPGGLNNNHKLWCCHELDFRSGVKIEELNRLIHEFGKQDQREYDDQRALEIHTAKDFIFSMLVSRAGPREQTSQTPSRVDQEEQALSRADQASQTPTRADQASQTPTRADPSNQTPSRADQAGLEPYRAARKPPRVEQTGQKPSRAERDSPRAEQTGPEPSRVERDSQRAEQTGQEPSRAERDSQRAEQTGMVQKLDQKLPVANEYLLLSGGVREGVVDMDLSELGIYNRGSDYDMAFTLLVPALKLHDRNQPVTLDMRHSVLGHSWLSLRLFDEVTINRWRDCCTLTDHLSGTTNYFFSPTLVADWFQEAVGLVLAELQRKPQRGTPRVERVERHNTLLSMILGVGSSRILYDIVPVVSFKGWPAVAQSWLMENHFWDGKITEEEVISGFYLLPACSASGCQENEWRLSFARSEVQLKKCISPGLMQAYQACKAIVIKLLAQPTSVSPYYLRSIMLWACDRLPASYLSQEDNAAHFLLGLIDDLQHCLVNKTCPNYFIPQCNMLEHLCDETAMFHARKLALVRSDPAEHLRTIIEQAKAANRLTQEMQRSGSSSGLLSPVADPSSADYQQPDDRLAKKLQQLVTENPGKSISVFINPDDVTRPHFRIDDKFF